VTRLLGIIVHNWPLKLAAVGLATLLYGGLLLSQGTTTLDNVSIPVVPRNYPPEPPATFLLNTIDPVTEVRYFSPSGRRPLASTFEAWVDLTDIQAGTGPVSVPVRMESIDPEINVVSFTPERVTVDLDIVSERQIPVVVAFGTPPPGLTTGEVQVEPDTVTVSGPKSEVDTIVAVRADVVIQPSGISVDQDVPVVPVNAEGLPVAPVNLDPQTVHVTIPVFQDVRNKSLPVSPVVTGDPAPGFEIDSVVVEPNVVTVAGDAEQLAGLVSVETVPVSVSGASEDVEEDAALALPAGVVPVDVGTVTVTITLRPVTATRNIDAGLDLIGETPGQRYELSADGVILTLGGSVADLDRLSGATIVGLLDVTDLEPGTSDVPVTVDLPAGVALVAASPDTITVTITVPVPSPSASAVVEPSPSPGG
jgi:YbbR domain-containing protein